MMNIIDIYIDHINQANQTAREKQKIRAIFFRFARETLNERELTADPPKYKNDQSDITHHRYIPLWHMAEDEDLLELYRITKRRR